MESERDPESRPVRLVCDPAIHDLPRLLLDGGQVVLSDMPPHADDLEPGDEVDLTDGVIIVAATAVKRYPAYGAWCLRVQPYLPRVRLEE